MNCQLFLYYTALPYKPCPGGGDIRLWRVEVVNRIVLAFSGHDGPSVLRSLDVYILNTYHVHAIYIF